MSLQLVHQISKYRLKNEMRRKMKNSQEINFETNRIKESFSMFCAFHINVPNQTESH